MPTRVLNEKTPISMLFPYRDCFNFIPHIFGCVCIIHNHGPSIKKLVARSIKGVFLDYSSPQKSYCCLDLVSGRWHFTKDATLIEKLLYFSKNSSKGDYLGNSNKFGIRSILKATLIFMILLQIRAY